MKALTLLLCILALLGSAASGYFWWQIGETKTQLRQDLTNEQARATKLRADLDESTATVERKDAALTQSEAALADAKRNLTAAETRNVQVARELETLKKAVAAKEESEKALNRKLDELGRELAQARFAAQVGSPEELENAKKTIADLEARIAELQTGGTRINATPGQGNLSQRTAFARVARVGTRNAFVVLDLGTEDGITAGHKFSITRDGQTIAESVISEVQETYAIAQVVPSSIKSALQAGDIATFHN
jgi:ribosomal protein L29